MRGTSQLDRMARRLISPFQSITFFPSAVTVTPPFRTDRTTVVRLPPGKMGPFTVEAFDLNDRPLISSTSLVQT